MPEEENAGEDRPRPFPWVAPGQFFDGTHYLLRNADFKEISKEVVVCVHGIGSYYTTFNRLAEFLLSKGFAVLQFDLIGRGFSEPSKNGKYGREEHVEQMYNLLNHLKLLRPQYLHIIGHSMGGCLSTLFTAQYGEFVKSLTLIAPAGLLGYFPIEFTKQLCPCLHGIIRRMLADRESARKAWRDDFYNHEGDALKLENEWIAELDAVYDNNPHAFDAFWYSVMEFPLSNIRDDIVNVAKFEHIPIILFWGKKDKACSFSNLVEWEMIINETRKNNRSPMKKIFELGAHGILSEFHQEMNLDIFNFLASHSTSDNCGDVVVLFDSEM